MIVADTSGIYAAIDAGADEHEAVVSALATLTEPPLVSPFVVAEVDYLLTTRFGYKVAVTFLEDVVNGEYDLVDFNTGDLGAALGLIRRYKDLNIGVTDASLAVIAARYGTTRVLTLDHRHFRPMQPLWGEAFTLLPADG